MPPVRTDRTERTSPDPKIRKMRKGTHSCFECRRRKIRCIYPQDNSEVCSECFARGSKCIDQEHATADAVVDQRKNLRERVSRLESLIETLLEEREGPSRTSNEEILKNLRGEPFPHSPPLTDVPSHRESDKDAPLLQLFNNDVLSRAEGPGTPVSEGIPVRSKSVVETLASNGQVLQFECATESQPENTNDAQSSATKEKYERTRRAIIAALPPYNEIIDIFSKNADWWLTFRQKCPGTAWRYEGLKEFAIDALTRGYPPQLGMLALGIGISMDTDNIEKYVQLVDREIISDDEYAATLEGMECLILQSKIYADIGQPRKAWLCYRRGLMFAQLMGLHRNHSMSPERDSIWWVLYQGDRFISLLLGLPYNIVDAHCDLEIKGPMADHTKNPFPFLVGIARLAGKVIDRNQGPSHASYSGALDLDAELERLSTQVPPDWWDTNTLEQALVDVHRPDGAAKLRERVLSQIAYQQIRVYLHLPFMLQSANNPRYDYSRTTCLSAAREMLRLYHLLRAGTGQPLYECKAVDFLGFTASILVLLGLLGYGRMGAIPNPVQEEVDWRMIEISMDIFRRASNEKGGKVAAQSYTVLEQLSMARNSGCDPSKCPSGVSAKVVIPYFGTISVRPGQGFNADAALSGTNSTVTTPPSMGSGYSPTPSGSNSLSGMTSATTPSSQGAPNLIRSKRPQQAQPNPSNDPFLVYDGFYVPFEQNSNAQNPVTSVSNPDGNQAHSTFGAGEDGLGTFSAWNGGVGAMDIDQDWNWFLNDAQNMGPGMGMGAGTIGGQGIGGMGATGGYFP